MTTKILALDLLCLSQSLVGFSGKNIINRDQVIWLQVLLSQSLDKLLNSCPEQEIVSQKSLRENLTLHYKGSLKQCRFHQQS
jgi:hypothetical protein